MAKLTEKQKRFCDEYLIDLNATQAAIRAGYSNKTANRIGTENLSKPVIQKYIEQRLVDREKRTEITQDRVLKELSKIGFLDATGFVKIQNGRVFIESTDDLSPDQKAAIAGIKETQSGTEIKLYDKLKALELIGRHLGMFTDKIEHSGGVAINNPFAELTKEQLLKLAGEDDG
ncbi:MAG: terminase small subunit [Acetobacterium woodii]|nr:terminase small subunit [Acetobacterium woodii]